MQEYEPLRALFDAPYYLARYPDIAAAGIDPLTHYCTNGWLEGRDPSNEFDTCFYLQRNPDVAALGINPLWHYMCAGKAEGRSPRPHSPALRKQLAATWAEVYTPPRVLPAPSLGLAQPVSVLDLVQNLKASHTGGDIVISVSHDDYAVCIGGVQNIVGDECAEFRRRGQSYLHLCPARPSRTLVPDADGAEFEFAVRLNHEPLGRIKGPALHQVLRELRRSEMRVVWVIHHLMGHSTGLLRGLIEEWRPVTPLFWTHDYFAVCSNPTLMRNGLTYCGTPAPTSAACRVCAYGERRPPHILQIEAFVRGIAPRLISPSRRALELWIKGTGIDDLDCEVVAPATLLMDPRPMPARAAAPLRVAFLGAPQFHKGWNIFENLAERMKGDSRYEFHQYGGAGAIPHYVRHIDVRVSAECRDAMTHALVADDIDVAIIWSLCPETFCFTVHEAMAAGAFVVFRQHQGHVDAAVACHVPGRSKGLCDEQSLFDYFSSGRLVADVSKVTSHCGVLLPAAGSAEVLTQELVA